jgi:serine/threonine-protein kinase
MYEMLTGRTPFDGDTPVAVAMQHIQDIPQPPTQLNPNIPPALEDIIMRCLEKIPEMRYRDGNSLARALEALGEAAAGEVRPLSPSANSPNVSEANNYHSSGTPPNSLPNQQRMTPPSDNRQGRQYSPVKNGVSPMPDVGDALGPNGANGLRTEDYAQLSNDATIQMDQQGDPYNAPALADSASTLPHRRDSIRVQMESRGSRIITVVTVLIVLAALILLGFAIYVVGLISSSAGPAPVATPTSQHTSGVPIPYIAGMPLAQAQQLLKSKGIQSIQVQVDPNDPNDPNLGENVVTRTDPPAGQTLQNGKKLTLYITNSTQGTPTAQPTSQQTAAPTSGVTPTPKPTPTPSPSPTPTPTTPAPTPTPTPTPTSTVISIP